MMNLIRADFYRVSKNWVTYLPFVGLFLLHAIFGIGSPLILGNVPVDASGLSYVEHLLNDVSFVFLIAIIPFVFCVSVPSFSDGTIKNDISWGMSRTALYISKLLVLVILSVLLYVFFIGSGLLLATIFFGFGDVLPGFWLNLLQAMGAQLFGVLAVCALMLFLSFLFKKPYVLTEILAGILLVPMVIDLIARLFGADLSWVLYFDLPSTIQNFGSLGLLDSRMVFIGLGVTATWFFTSLLAGITLLKKAEIK